MTEQPTPEAPRDDGPGADQTGETQTETLAYSPPPESHPDWMRSGWLDPAAQPEGTPAAAPTEPVTAAPPVARRGAPDGMGRILGAAVLSAILASGGTVLVLDGTGALNRPASCEGAQPRQQLGEEERFDQIVIGAVVEPGDAIVDAVAGRQEQHQRLVTGRAQPSAHREPVEPGEHDIEDDDVELSGFRGRQRIDVIAFLARRRGALPIPGHGHRVDRVHRPAGRAQHRHQQAGVDRPRTRSTVIIAFMLAL